MDLTRFLRDTHQYDKNKAPKGGVMVASSAMFKKPYHRSGALSQLSAYYEGTQYDHLMDWEQAELKSQDLKTYVPIRQRRPRLVVNFAKTFAQRVAAKLVGESVFPQFTIEGSPIDEEFIKWVLKASNLRANMLEATRKMLNSGSVFVRFYVKAGRLIFEHYDSNHCFPQFNEAGDLEGLTIKYVYETKEQDVDGKPVKRWFKMSLNQFGEVLFDNPIYRAGESEPSFEVAEEIQHDLGFVQGEWFKTSGDHGNPDGPSLVADILAFIDEVNYNLSQSSRAIGYNQDPQLLLKNMDEDEIEALIRSSARSWNMGRNGEAAFLESDLSGAQVAGDYRKELRTNIIDIARIVLLDPDKMVTHATSGRAMEVLHGPLMDLIDEVRPFYGQHLVNLVTKMAMTILISARRGIDVPITMPPLYTPQSLAIELKWPPVFPLTTEDLQKLTSVVSSATSANVISRESGTRYLAKHFGITDIEAELQKIAAQPVLNPFGGF